MTGTPVRDWTGPPRCVCGLPPRRACSTSYGACRPVGPVYAYQVLVLDELARFGVEVHFTDAPDFANGDPLGSPRCRGDR